MNLKIEVWANPSCIGTPANSQKTLADRDAFKCKDGNTLVGKSEELGSYEVQSGKCKTFSGIIEGMYATGSMKLTWSGWCNKPHNNSGSNNGGGHGGNNSGIGIDGNNSGNNSGNNNAATNDTFQNTLIKPTNTKYVNLKIYLDDKCSTEMGIDMPAMYGYTEKGIEKWCVNGNKLQDPAKKTWDGEKISNGQCISQGAGMNAYSKVSWSGFCDNTSGKSKSFPWWAILLIVVGAVALIGGIGYCICKNKKTSGGNKKSGCHV